MTAHPQLIQVPETALGRGLRQLLADFEARVQPTQPLRMYLAGGMAVHLYLGVRVSSDVDAEFSARVFLPQDLAVDVILEDGRRLALHFDTNYNSTFSLMHEDYVLDSVPTDLRTPMLELRVLSPVDLAVSKISRFAEVDREDIRALVFAGLTSPSEIESRATEALVGYVGGLEMVRLNLRDALAIAREAEQERGLARDESPDPPRG